MKKAVLSVSFGTSYAQTREKTIDVVDALVRDAFQDRAFYSAWTSGRIVAKVREQRAEHHDTLDEAFARLAADGVQDLLVTTMCLMQGHEMEKIAAATQMWAQAKPDRTARLAKPLLSDADDRVVLAQAICDEFADVGPHEALLLMGHGSQDARQVVDGMPHNANAVYGQIQDELHKLGRSRFFVGTVEGTPTFDDAFSLVKASGADCVHLAPFMIVAGDHATNDLAGDDEDSWKNLIEAQGLRTQVHLKGLGEYAAVQNLVVQHAHAVLDAKA